MPRRHAGACQPRFPAKRGRAAQWVGGEDKILATTLNHHHLQPPSCPALLYFQSELTNCQLPSNGGLAGTQTLVVFYVIW